MTNNLSHSVANNKNVSILLVDIKDAATSNLTSEALETECPAKERNERKRHGSNHDNHLLSKSNSLASANHMNQDKGIEKGNVCEFENVKMKVDNDPSSCNRHADRRSKDGFKGSSYADHVTPVLTELHKSTVLPLKVRVGKCSTEGRVVEKHEKQMQHKTGEKSTKSRPEATRVTVADVSVSVTCVKPKESKKTAINLENKSKLIPGDPKNNFVESVDGNVRRCDMTSDNGGLLKTKDIGDSENHEHRHRNKHVHHRDEQKEMKTSETGSHSHHGSSQGHALNGGHSRHEHLEKQLVPPIKIKVEHSTSPDRQQTVAKYTVNNLVKSSPEKLCTSEKDLAKQVSCQNGTFHRSRHDSKSKDDMNLKVSTQQGLNTPAKKDNEKSNSTLKQTIGTPSYKRSGPNKDTTSNSTASRHTVEGQILAAGVANSQTPTKSTTDVISKKRKHDHIESRHGLKSADTSDVKMTPNWYDPEFVDKHDKHQPKNNHTPKKMKLTDTNVEYSGAVSMNQPELDYALRSQSKPVDGLKYGNLIHIETSGNGGATVVHSYHEEISQLDPKQISKFVNEYFRVAFEEEAEFTPKHVMAIIHGATRYLPDLIEYFADNHPEMIVKKTAMGKPEVETTTMAGFRNIVHDSYCAGTYRSGGLLHISLVGTKAEETGGFFPEFLDVVEECPFLRVTMPWGELSSIENSPRNESNDGPIMWSRPGEQVVPTAELPKSPMSQAKKRYATPGFI